MLVGMAWTVTVTAKAWQCMQSLVLEQSTNVETVSYLNRLYDTEADVWPVDSVSGAAAEAK